MSACDLPLPQQAIEAEQSLIGGLLIDAGAWDRIADVVTEADFYRDNHRRIFAVIRRLAETGKEVDVLTVADAMSAAGETEVGLGDLGDLANATHSAANIRRHGEIIAEKARLRALVAFAADVELVAGRIGSDSAQERIDELATKLLALAEHGPVKSEPRAVSEILGRVIEEIEARMERGGEISGMATGLADLDGMVDGLKGGDLIVVAGRPSMGKTALALNIAEHVGVDLGDPVLVFSLEMGDRQLVTRSISSLSGINGKALASGRLSDEEWDRVTAAMGKLHQAPLFIDQSASLTVGQMRTRARRQKRKTGLALVVIDYLQLMRGDGNTRNEELGDITRQLKLLARDLGVPVILLSQLSRKCEERTDKRPMLSDLRESGAIEQDADVVMMIYRDDYYHSDSPYAGLAEVLVRKNRMGACGDLKLVFQPEFSRFRDADRGAIAEAAQRVHERKPVKRGGFRE